MHRTLVVRYRRFGTIYQSHCHGSIRTFRKNLSVSSSWVKRDVSENLPVPSSWVKQGVSETYRSHCRSSRTFRKKPIGPIFMGRAGRFGITYRSRRHGSAGRFGITYLSRRHGSSRKFRNNLSVSSSWVNQDVSEQPVGPIIMGQAVQVYLDCLTHDDRTDNEVPNSQ